MSSISYIYLTGFGWYNIVFQYNFSLQDTIYIIRKERLMLWKEKKMLMQCPLDEYYYYCIDI